MNEGVMSHRYTEKKHQDETLQHNDFISSMKLSVEVFICSHLLDAGPLDLGMWVI